MPDNVKTNIALPVKAPATSNGHPNPKNHQSFVWQNIQCENTGQICIFPQDRHLGSLF
jgi:hypothetical protein